jgi:hypothetical protein
LLEAGLACEIAIAHELLYEALRGSTRGEIATAADSQCLIDRLLEAEVSLLDIAILMSNTRIVPSRLHAIVSHEPLIAL